jgi:hypothetical protein
MLGYQLILTEFHKNTEENLIMKSIILLKMQMFSMQRLQVLCVFWQMSKLKVILNGNDLQFISKIEDIYLTN